MTVIKSVLPTAFGETCRANLIGSCHEENELNHKVPCEFVCNQFVLEIKTSIVEMFSECICIDRESTIVQKRQLQKKIIIHNHSNIFFLNIFFLHRFASNFSFCSQVVTLSWFPLVLTSKALGVASEVSIF